MGFCGFSRKFIKNYGRIAKPLNEATHKDTVFSWTSECNAAFEALKNAIVTSPVLRYYHFGAKHLIETDASDGVTAAVMFELDEETKNWHPVDFTSKTMAPAELKYPIHDKEMLAIVRAFEEWRPELTAHETKIPVHTDHKALEYFMSTKDLSQRQIRWCEFLSSFNFEITYKTRKKNIRADALTRREGDMSAQAIIIKEQRLQTFLKPEQIDPQIQSELSLIIYDPLLIEEVIKANRISNELEVYRSKVRNEKVNDT